MEEKEIEVDVSILRVIYEAALSTHYRVNSLLEDNIMGNFPISETEKSLLLEFCASSTTLKVLFESLFEDFSSINTEKVSLGQEVYMAIIGLAKTVEMASRSAFGSVVLWAH